MLRITIKKSSGITEAGKLEMTRRQQYAQMLDSMLASFAVGGSGFAHLTCKPPELNPMGREDLDKVVLTCPGERNTWHIQGWGGKSIADLSHESIKRYLQRQRNITVHRYIEKKKGKPDRLRTYIVLHVGREFFCLIAEAVPREQG